MAEAKPPALPAKRWRTAQVMFRDPEQTTPVEDALTAGGSVPVGVITKLRLLRQHGWPDARAAMMHSNGSRLIVRPDRKEPPIWELKCKPDCWRLYFHVYEKSAVFAFVHAVCKRQDREDQRSAKRARRNFNKLGARDWDLTPLPLEDDGSVA